MRDRCTETGFAKFFSLSRIYSTFRLPVVCATLLALAGSFPVMAQQQQAALSGLWAGTAQLGEVSSFGSIGPAPAAGVFNLPLIVHVDSQSGAVLLKEVVLLRGETGDRLLADPGSRRSELAAMPESELRNARRVATAAFDFDGAALPLSETFKPGATLTGTITIGSDSPSNPFSHIYHPDHDNRVDADPAREPDEAAAEVYRITRRIEIRLPDRPPDVPPEVLNDLTGEPVVQIVGLYTETVSGLAAQPVTTRGRLFLTRISTTAEIER